MGYNGWSNYATWAVNLWIANEQASYFERCQLTDDTWDDTDEEETPEERSLDARVKLAERLETWITEIQPDLGATLWSDLLRHAIGQTDWHELADNYLSDTEGYVARKDAA